MLRIANLERQHVDISEIMDRIQNKLSQNQIQEYSMIISKDINILAGKLKIHLQEEDRWLYPSMEKSNNPKLLEFHKTYQNEMKGLLIIFTDYKIKYNTSSKILKNIDTFIVETNDILNALKARINKENHNLYPLLQNI